MKQRSIYHITTADAWTAAQHEGAYRHPSLQTEGFIHCSTRQQVPRTIARHFPDTKGLLLLEIETDKLEAKLVYENTSGGTEPFPHVYGTINPDAVNRVIEWDVENW